MATSANRFVHRPNAIDRLGDGPWFTRANSCATLSTRAFLHWMVGIFFLSSIAVGISGSTCRGSFASLRRCSAEEQ